MKDWGLFLWGLFLAVFALIGAILLRVFIDYRQIGILKWYLAILAAYIIGIYLNTKRV